MTSTESIYEESSSVTMPSKIVSEYLKNKGPQWKALDQRDRPLTLLELPVDILRLIVKEITHTNDLTALALTNSALYNLAIPFIYSRFDIVWPDGNLNNTESKSVDALTYGLSTLCLGSRFARATRAIRKPLGEGRPPTDFLGNDYASYTKKFSLGNGPNDWISEYMITKESGKMLGTLAALAISRMKNLEAFVWDMPTGVLADIFMALSSLADQRDNDCKLSRVWVRWHDNSPDPLVPPMTGNANTVPGVPPNIPFGSQLTPVGIMLPANTNHPPPRAAIPYSAHKCEYPTFSVLPPLKSLTVLDIDELAYLDEMAELIGRSLETLQELRVGISAKAAAHKDFVQAWDGPGLKQIDHKAKWPGESTIGERRLGGVLGVLVGKIYDIKKLPPARPKEKNAANAPPPLITGDNGGPSSSSTVSTPVSAIALQSSGISLSVSSIPGATGEANLEASGSKSSSAKAESASATSQAASRPSKPASKPSSSGGRKRLENKLKLHTLELERVPLSLQVCRHAIDWTCLTHITLLDCAQHENLWKLLRKQFPPIPLHPHQPAGSGALPTHHYQLKITSIHTDKTTPALISFIKETLCPNTLEVLFLQDRGRRRPGPPSVTLDAVFKGAIKPHRSSLKKLLLDSSNKMLGGGGNAANAANPVDNARWKNWVLTTEVVLYLTSGRMTNLRELAVSLDYKDWHTLLQRLSNLPQLRSLNIPHVAEYAGGGFEPRELAHQVVDIITLRPEIKLCYLGIGQKCFEILETRDAPGGSAFLANSSATGGGGPPPLNLPVVGMPPIMPIQPIMPNGMNGINGMAGMPGMNGMGNGVGGMPVAVPGGIGGGVGGGMNGGVTLPGANGDTTADDSTSESEAEDDEGLFPPLGPQNDDEDSDDDEDEEDENDDDNTPTTATSEEAMGQSDAASTTAGGTSTGTVLITTGIGGANAGAGAEDDDDDGFVEPDAGGIRLRLREILFYDDRVAIFRARHGRL